MKTTLGIIRSIAFWIVTIVWGLVLGWLVLSVPVGLWTLLADFDQSWHALLQLLVFLGTERLLAKLGDWLEPQRSL